MEGHVDFDDFTFGFPVLPAEGESVGFIVLTETQGRWCDDWDGIVHTTYQEGQEALRAASAVGVTCFLVECHRVASNGEPFGNIEVQ